MSLHHAHCAQITLAFRRDDSDECFVRVTAASRLYADLKSQRARTLPQPFLCSIMRFASARNRGRNKKETDGTKSDSCLTVYTMSQYRRFEKQVVNTICFAIRRIIYNMTIGFML